MTDCQGFIYEWTNKLTNKKYIGAHTGPVDDGYIGGGKKFRDDLRKFGLVNFERKILEYVKDATKIKDRENYYLDLFDAAENEEYYNTARRSSGLRTKTPSKQKPRGTCCVCNQRPVAVNYTKDNITHYRSKCDRCIKLGRKEKPPVPRWQQAGYKKKSSCDRCGFRARFPSQLLVYHVDGNQANTKGANLRTICLNCVEEVRRLDVPWKPGDLLPDHLHGGTTHP